MAARSLNKVELIGNLTRDPELRYTPSGTAVCTFGIATNREWTDSSGQHKEEAEFHNIVAWAKLAEICDQILHKGRKTYVEGRISTREWEGKDGQNRKTMEIVIDEMIAFGKGQWDDSSGGGKSDDSSGDEDGLDLDTSDLLEEEAPKEESKEEEEEEKEEKGEKKKKEKKSEDDAEEVADDIPF